MTTLGYSVDPSAWDESGAVNPRYTNSKGIPASKINNRILKIKLHFAEYESELKTHPTIEELKEQFNIAITLGDGLSQNEIEVEAPAKSIYNYLDEFIKEESVLNQWAHATVQCWNTFRNHLLSFGKRLKFRDFNEKGLSRFVMHLRKKKRQSRKPEPLQRLETSSASVPSPRSDTPIWQPSRELTATEKKSTSQLRKPTTVFR